MSAFRSGDAYQVIWLVRRLFRALSEASNRNLEGLGITSADRAVLEFLYPDAQMTVPALAERYQVSRQHVQVTVNRLAQRSLLETGDNPRHRRSSLYSLSGQGRALFEQVLGRDRAAVEALFADLPAADLATTRASLQVLLDRLGSGEAT